MGQGDASTVTMMFAVSVDIVGVRVVWGLDICQIFMGLLVVFTIYDKKHNRFGPVDLNCTGDFGNFALSTFQYYSPTLC